ncbi:MAG: uridine kinase [Clostridia bacterium]|nr:uridine kinase [Clostridia bacterium]
MLVIGIAGGSGSGKSAIAQKLKEQFGDSLTLICHDDYYRPQDKLSPQERLKINYDHPDAFDTELLCRHLSQLRKGKAVDVPIYDYTTHTRSGKTKKAFPSDIIVVEGILIFENESLRSEFDIKIFVDTDADIRLVRRIRRDVKERGRSLDSVIEQYLCTVKPMHDSFVEPSKKKADIIIPEGASNSVALEMLFSRINNTLTGQG